MRHPPFEEYVMTHARCDKPGARTEAIIFQRDQLSAGLFPERTVNFRGRFGAWLKTIPLEHREPAGRLWREYDVFKARRTAYKAAKVARRLSLLRQPKNLSQRKTYSLMDFIR